MDWTRRQVYDFDSLWRFTMLNHRNRRIMRKDTICRKCGEIIYAGERYKLLPRYKGPIGNNSIKFYDVHIKCPVVPTRFPFPEEELPDYGGIIE
jgi:hypothetical protein